MQVDITEKEKTALSILLGLRQKFAKEKKTDETYSANELHITISELLLKIKKEEMDFMDTLLEINAPDKPREKLWGPVEKAIDKSKIRRYNWQKVFGRSLTQEILIFRNKHYSVENTYQALRRDQRVLDFISTHLTEKRKILENLKISVHARFIENKTAEKIKSKS